MLTHRCHADSARPCRFVVTSMARFDTRLPMISMTMGEYLAAARNQEQGSYVDTGETLPLGGARGLPGGGGARGSGYETQFAGITQDLPGMDGPRSAFTDSDRIIVRFGVIKGMRKTRDVHALYFPKECAPACARRAMHRAHACSPHRAAMP
jgi:hypothetical protein